MALIKDEANKNRKAPHGRTEGNSKTTRNLSIVSCGPRGTIKPRKSLEHHHSVQQRRVRKRLHTLPSPAGFPGSKRPLGRQRKENNVVLHTTTPTGRVAKQCCSSGTRVQPTRTKRKTGTETKSAKKALGRKTCEISKKGTPTEAEQVHTHAARCKKRPISTTSAAASPQRGASTLSVDTVRIGKGERKKPQSKGKKNKNAAIARSIASASRWSAKQRALRAERTSRTPPRGARRGSPVVKRLDFETQEPDRVRRLHAHTVASASKCRETKRRRSPALANKQADTPTKHLRRKNGKLVCSSSTRRPWGSSLRAKPISPARLPRTNAAARTPSEGRSRATTSEGTRSLRLATFQPDAIDTFGIMVHAQDHTGDTDAGHDLTSLLQHFSSSLPLHPVIGPQVSRQGDEKSGKREVSEGVVTGIGDIPTYSKTNREGGEEHRTMRNREEAVIEGQPRSRGQNGHNTPATNQHVFAFTAPVSVADGEDDPLDDCNLFAFKPRINRRLESLEKKGVRLPAKWREVLESAWSFVQAGAEAHLAFGQAVLQT